MWGAAAFVIKLQRFRPRLGEFKSWRYSALRPRVMSITQRRAFYDVFAKYGIAVGGIAVIAAIALIFFYLFYVVAPLFFPAQVRAAAVYSAPVDGAGADGAHLGLEELGEVATRFRDNGVVEYFNADDGRLLGRERLPVPAGAQVTAVATGQPGNRVVALGLSNGQALVAQYQFDISYPGGRRTVTPVLTFPFGEPLLAVDPLGRPITHFAVRHSDSHLGFAAVLDNRLLRYVAFDKSVNMMTDAVQVEWAFESEFTLSEAARFLLLGPNLANLYVADADGFVNYFDISKRQPLTRTQRVEAAPEGGEITQLRYLLEGISLLIGDSEGGLAQWFPVRDAANRQRLVKVRSFEPMPSAITEILSEPRRKGFLVGDREGNLGLYHTTSHRTLYRGELMPGPIRLLAVSPRSKVVLAENAGGQVAVADVYNEHPEVSWSALWGEVWYESYDRPSYTWQSSSANTDFEPKFSLAPLTFGTFKAAFFAMLVAVPLGIMGAVFTANFMSAGMRRYVKPTIEIMEAMPTVILGFLAGLWLAPFLEANLPGVAAMLIFFPIGMLAAALIWSRLPQRLRNATEGWEAALLIPVVVVIGVLSIALSQPMEQWFFGGDLRLYITQELGLDYDQRNSIVVGLAMGFAVIPTIYSISEDAIFSVPRHLINGSLALGATTWQTLVNVVMPTASPGIFSALMMGLGRAVGETMIVLMATGNTPVMDMSILQGMRTLSANVAVEMPESEVDSTHYRVLFLAALVLFMLTFVFNTGAEVVRQRLRKRYGNL